jgi:hypothetical protein
MRNAGRLKLGFYPLPQSEAVKLRAHLTFPTEPFSALDPCVGDGAAFHTIVDGTSAMRHGIELDSYRTEQARQLGITVVHGNTLEVQCRVDSLSFIYLNPPYDFEVGKTDNQRMEVVFLRHTGRWLIPGGVLFFIIPQNQLTGCARTLAEHFEHIQVYRLTSPESVKYNQIAVLAVRRSRNRRLRDDVLTAYMAQLSQLSQQDDLPPLQEPGNSQYCIPPSEAPNLVYQGLPFDEIEDKLPGSSAYRQVKRTVLRERGTVRGRPLTPLHGGHVGLLCTAGMLNGVFGQDQLRHVANWQSRKYTETWQEDGEGSNVHHTREYFTHECTLLWATGETQVLTHEPPTEDGEGGTRVSDPESTASQVETQAKAKPTGQSRVIVMPARGKPSSDKPGTD